MTTITKQGYVDGSGDIKALPATVDIATVLLTKAAATNTQRIGFPFGGTPKATFYWRNGVTSTTIPFNYGNGNKQLGYNDGTTENCTADMVDSESSPNYQNCVYTHSDNMHLRREQSAAHTGAPEAGYTHSAFGAGYADIEVTDQNGEDNWATCVSFSGDLVSNSSVWSATMNGTNAVSVSLAFEADLLILSTNWDDETFAGYDDVAKNATSDDLTSSFGVVVNGASVVQGCSALGTLNQAAVGNVNTTKYLGDNACLAKVQSGSASVTISAGNFSGTGFDLTPSATASSAVVTGIAIKFAAGVNVELLKTTYPTAGAWTQSDAAGKPFFVWNFAEHGISAYNTATQAQEMTEISQFFNGHHLISHNRTFAHGVNSHDTQCYSCLQTTLDVWETDVTPTTPARIMRAGKPTLNLTGWTVTPSEFPASTIPGHALVLST